MYEKFFKRMMDIVLSLFALIVLSPVLLILSILGAMMMKGNPFFAQLRPGKIDKKTGKEKIFKLIKFRTMSYHRDKHGKLLPDGARLNAYGKFLRSTSLDELPELINIIKGDMSIVGPRPQLVCDMVFMTAEERKRHTVLPGLTGLAQCSGRNAISWEKKFEKDMEYIEKITLWEDIKILFMTVGKIFSRDGINEEGMDTAMDLGDYLLLKGKVEKSEYDAKHAEAKTLLLEQGERA